MSTRPPVMSPSQLRERESTLTQMVQQIEAKLTRLSAARSSRATALNHIRAELARAILHGGSAGPESNERR